MSLTGREKEIVVNTWTMATKDINATGMALFKQFFEDNPSYQSHFPFRDVHSWEELSKDKRLKAHAANVMYYLSMMIQNIDDTEVFVEMVEKIARSHIRRKLSVEHFESLKKTLVKVLVQALGESVMTEEAITAWAKAYATITDTIDRQATHSSE